MPFNGSFSNKNKKPLLSNIDSNKGFGKFNPFKMPCVQGEVYQQP
jgi:hypothetical protein